MDFSSSWKKLLVVFGILDNENNNQTTKEEKHGDLREKLISLLDVLANSLKLMNEYDDKNENENNEQLQLLLKVEETCRNIRNTCFQLLQLLEQQKDDLIKLGFKIEEEIKDSHHLAKVIVCRSLISKFQKQKYHEITIITKIGHYLDNLYNHNNMQLSSTEFIQLARTLSLMNPQYILDIMQKKRILSLFKRKPHHQKKEIATDQFFPTTTKLPPEVGDPNKNDNNEIIVNQEKEEKISLDGFPFPLLRSADRIQKILLLGSEGTGKTFICDQIQTLANPQDTVGMDILFVLCFCV